MSRRVAFVTSHVVSLVVSRGLVFMMVAVLGLTGAATSRAATASTKRSTAKERSQMSVTVYNTDLALIREVRKMQLGTGVFQLEYKDVAQTLRPETVSVKSASGAKALHVLEQNYRYDLLTPEKLLEKYVGKQVKLYRYNEKLGTEQAFNAELLSVANGPVYKIGNEITSNFYGRVAFPSVPENLIAQPTLVWLVDSTQAAQDVEVSYLASGMNWHADYVLVLNADEKMGDLTGWVTLNNNSGTAFNQAALKLVAGDVQQVAPQAQMAYDMEESRAAKMAAPRAPGFSQEQLLDYHLYTLGRPVTLLNNEQKQVTLLEAKNVAVKKKLVLSGQSYWYRSSFGGEVSHGQKLGIYVEFENKKQHNLGMPIPKGVVRVYKADSSKAQQFVGEDYVDHTAEDEKIRIKLGEAFDVVADRKQVSWNTLGMCSSESTWQIDIRNHKKQAEEVHVIEPAGGDWEVSQNSHPFVKEDAQTFRFVLKVPAKGKVTVKYKIRTRWC